jgi:hypothetical protein
MRLAATAAGPRKSRVRDPYLGLTVVIDEAYWPP